MEGWMGACVWRLGWTVEDRLMYGTSVKAATSGNGYAKEKKRRHFTFDCSLFYSSGNLLEFIYQRHTHFTRLLYGAIHIFTGFNIFYIHLFHIIIIASEHWVTERQSWNLPLSLFTWNSCSTVDFKSVSASDVDRQVKWTRSTTNGEQHSSGHSPYSRITHIDTVTRQQLLRIVF